MDADLRPASGPDEVRAYVEFPPFGQDQLDNSLQRLSDLVAQVWRP